MASQRTLIGAAAFTLALAAGGVAGAVLGTPGLSGAQDGGTSTTESAPTASADQGPGGRFGHLGGDLLTTAAKTLGMTEDELRTELQSGKSIADVAKEEGVDEQKVVDALVAESTSKLESAIDKLPDTMSDLVERKGLGDHDGRRGHPVFRHLELDTAAGAIGISTDALRTELQSGKTIADVAKAHDVDPQKVIDAMVAKSDAAVDKAVEAGRVDADKAADVKAKAKDRITTFVNEGGPKMGDRPDGAGFDGGTPGALEAVGA